MDYKTYIVTLEIDSNKGRKDLEAIENEKFDSVDAVRNALCFDEDAPVEEEKVGVFPLTDFMDYCNNTDDETPEDERIDLSEMWIGYVQIKQK